MGLAARAKAQAKAQAEGNPAARYWPLSRHLPRLMSTPIFTASATIVRALGLMAISLATACACAARATPAAGPAPVDATLRLFARRVEELETLLA